MKDLNDYENNLIIKKLTGAATPLEEQQLNEWLQQSADNQEIYADTVKAWEITREENSHFNIDVNAAWEKVHKNLTENNTKTKIIKLKHPWLTLSIAASVILIIGISWLFMQNNYNKIGTVTYNTFNEKKVIILPDNSTIHLCPNSTISYLNEFSDKERRITLTGEAYFNVQKDSLHPFTVIGNRSQVTVLGTSFTVHSYTNEETETVEVFTGKVACTSKINNRAKVIVYPGYKASIAIDGKIVTNKVEETDLTTNPAPKINFNNVKLSEVITSLQKNFGVTITLANKKLNNCRYTGSFEETDISQIIEIIALSMNLTYEKQQNAYILNGNACPN